jgi:hypothetical protein
MENITIIAQMLSKEIQQELTTGYTLTAIGRPRAVLSKKSGGKPLLWWSIRKSNRILSGKFPVPAVVKRFPMFVGGQPS